MHHSAVTSPDHAIQNKSLPNREALSLFADSLFRIGGASAGGAGSGIGSAALLMVLLVVLLGCSRCGASLIAACLSGRRGGSALS
jgi:hypothetical protein